MVAGRSTLLIACATVALLPSAALAQGVPTDIPAMTLKIADTFPPVGFIPTQEKAWAKNVTKLTGGKVKFQFFWSDSLFKQADSATDLAAGVADGARVPSTYDPAKTALWMTLDMPFNAKDPWCGMTSSVKVEHNEPNLKASFAKLGFIPVIGYSSGEFQFLSTTPIRKLSDLKGKRLRSYGGARIKMYSELGLSPIFMPYSEIYESIERGVIDGAEATILLTQSFKHYEVAKYMTLANSGMVLASPISFNKTRWDSFPESLKKIFIKAGLQHDRQYSRNMIAAEKAALKNFVDHDGMHIIKLDPADQKALEAAGHRAQEAWLTEMEGKGVPARATWTAFRKLEDACEADVAAHGHPWDRKS